MNKPDKNIKQTSMPPLFITKELNKSNLRILRTGVVLFCFIVILLAWILSLN